MKHSMCLHAFKASSKYKFDEVLFKVAEETNKKYVKLFISSLFDELFINCGNGLPYYDLLINNPYQFTLHPIWDGDSVDALHGKYLRRLNKKTNDVIEYDGAPKFFDYLEKEIKEYDPEFKVKILEDTKDRYVVRVSI